MKKKFYLRQYDGSPAAPLVDAKIDDVIEF